MEAVACRLERIAGRARRYEHLLIAAGDLRLMAASLHEALGTKDDG